MDQTARYLSPAPPQAPIVTACRVERRLPLDRRRSDRLWRILKPIDGCCCCCCLVHVVDGVVVVDVDVDVDNSGRHND